VGSPAPELREQDFGLNEQRTVIVYLDRSYVDEQGQPLKMKLEWNTGKASPLSRAVKVRKILKPGEQVRIPLERAQAYFGLFTIPAALEDEYNEDKRESMLASFEHEKRRAIMTWGEFPRGQATERGNGGAEIGPARLPPVILTVENADGSKEDPINLRELYGLGKFRHTAIRPTFMQIEHEARNSDEIAAMRSEMSALAASNAQLTGLVTGFQAVFAAMGITPEKLAALATGEAKKPEGKRQTAGVGPEQKGEE
jgi:hypothetical protein